MAKYFLVIFTLLVYSYSIIWQPLIRQMYSSHWFVVINNYSRLLLTFSSDVTQRNLSCAPYFTCRMAFCLPLQNANLSFLKSNHFSLFNCLLFGTNLFYLALIIPYKSVFFFNKYLGQLRTCIEVTSNHVISIP